MEVIETAFEGLKVIIPKVWEDIRGYFYESYNLKKYKAHGIDATFLQDNASFSTYGVVRGLHYQTPQFGQIKLVRVTQGEVLDVVVDLRKNSKTYGRHFSLILNDITKKQLLIPVGFAHGYAVLSESAVFVYKCSNYYAPKHEGGIIYNDENLNIDWLIPENERIVSTKDLGLSPFDQAFEF